MEVAALVLFLLCAVAAILTWTVLTRDPRRGWRSGWTAIVVALVIGWTAIGVWTCLVWSVSVGSRACFDCGRIERVALLGPLPCWWQELFDGGDYRAQFVDASAECSWHRWKAQGCTASMGGISCTLRSYDEWFRELPLLSDRALAERLVAQARSLPRRQESWFMHDVGRVIRMARSKGVPLETALAERQENPPPVILR